MKKILAAVLLAALLFVASSVSWGQGGVTWEGVTWETTLLGDPSGVTWE